MHRDLRVNGYKNDDIMANHLELATMLSGEHLSQTSLIQYVDSGITVL
jgi:hypothetical protein